MTTGMEKTNSDHFAGKAAGWDAVAARVAMADAVAAAMIRTVPLTPAMQVMDFGAGTGLVTLQLAPLVRTVTAVDISRAMLAELARKLTEQCVTNVSLQAAAPDGLPAADGAYDAVVSSMALHHVRELAPLLQRLRAVLRPGGRLVVADLDTEDGTFHHDPAGVFHCGFDRQEFGQLLEQAGFTAVAMHDAYHMQRTGADGVQRDYTLFLAIARAGATT
ncbi:MAG TPA: class I SAM-dependent methyltransferase, partial [bacterium]|nr:class I SAM-dependent methyltransferase [bacterium]